MPAVIIDRLHKLKSLGCTASTEGDTGGTRGWKFACGVAPAVAYRLGACEARSEKERAQLVAATKREYVIEWREHAYKSLSNLWRPSVPPIDVRHLTVMRGFSEKPGFSIESSTKNGIQASHVVVQCVLFRQIATRMPIPDMSGSAWKKMGEEAIGEVMDGQSVELFWNDTPCIQTVKIASKGMGLLSKAPLDRKKTAGSEIHTLGEFKEHLKTFSIEATDSQGNYEEMWSPKLEEL
ncbi:hypothetical protein C8J57DRAFT_1220769 [Mycena rebaudengoi]|nr:hypothetical protein C8J57DRAFT_1220769 [Mycena rebaudengoi]